MRDISQRFRGFTFLEENERLALRAKENVTMGRLIPAGTGFEYYRGVRIPADEPPPPPAPPQPTEDDMELDREMEYLIEPEEALGGGGTIE